MSDPVLALNIDLALTERARREGRAQLAELLNDDDRGFFAAVVSLLSELL